MVEKCLVFGGRGHIFIPIVSLANNLRSHYTFNASCFGMVSFSYVTAKKNVKCRTLLIGSFPMSPRDKNLSSGAYEEDLWNITAELTTLFYPLLRSTKNWREMWIPLSDIINSTHKAQWKKKHLKQNYNTTHQKWQMKREKVDSGTFPLLLSSLYGFFVHLPLPVKSAQLNIL